MALLALSGLNSSDFLVVIYMSMWTISQGQSSVMFLSLLGVASSVPGTEGAKESPVSIQ